MHNGLLNFSSLYLQNLLIISCDCGLASKVISKKWWESWKINNPTISVIFCIWYVPAIFCLLFDKLWARNCDLFCVKYLEYATFGSCSSFVFFNPNNVWISGSICLDDHLIRFSGTSSYVKLCEKISGLD